MGPSQKGHSSRRTGAKEAVWGNVPGHLTQKEREGEEDTGNLVNPWDGGSTLIEKGIVAGVGELVWVIKSSRKELVLRP